MWIILLDHSSSMSGGFKNAPKEGYLSKQTDAENRLKAAKQSLLELLGRWAPDDDVLLLPFTNMVDRIGPFKAGDRAGIESHLARINASGGTDIAAALLAAADEAQAIGERSTAFLISDGESNLQAAEDAAQKCYEADVTIFVYAIDPDEQSEILAMRVSSITKGNWQPVTSGKVLTKKATQAADFIDMQAKAADEMIERFDREHATLTQKRQGNEEVQFTASYPRRIRPKLVYPLQLAVHLEDELDEIEQKLKGNLERKGLKAQVVTAEAMMRLPLGTVLEIEPRLPGMIVSPRRSEVAWTALSVIVDFEMHTIRDDVELVEGAIEITTKEGLLVGRTPVTFRVAGDSGDTPDLTEMQSTRLIDRVFASYAHEDEAIVLACRKIYQGLGIQLFVDHEDIMSGEYWRDALAKAIGSSDLFQLFWSQASADSTEVKKEWVLALGLASQKPKNFVCPVHWHGRDPKPNPPQELGDIHFRYLDLSSLDVDEQATGVRTPSSAVPCVEIGSQLTLLPLVSDSADMADTIRDEMERVVPFLEQVTGLRYYPAPMLLVDHYVVRSVREILTVDKADDAAGAEPDPGAADWLIELLRSLLLAFHCRALDSSENMDDDMLAAFYDLVTRTDNGDFKCLRRHAEGDLVNLIKKRIQGHDPLSEVEDGSAALERALKDPRSGKWNLERYLSHLAAVCSDEDLEILYRILGQRLKWDGPFRSCTIGENELSAIVSHLQQPEATALRHRYAVGFNGLFDTEVTTLCREPDFIAFLRRSFELYQVYARRAIKERGDIPIKIGISLTHEALIRCQNELGLRLRIDDEEKEYYSKKGTGKYYYSIVCSEYGRAIGLVGQRLLRIIAAAPTPSGRLRRLVQVSVPTFGVCVLPSTKANAVISAAARSAGLPELVTLPQSTKVLVCRDMVDNVAEELVAAGEPETSVMDKSKSLLRAVLAHEHFHAILAFGLDRLGLSAGAVASRRLWKKGEALNESLAAWVEVHLAREDPWLSEKIDGYVKTGEYPTWPYRGAEAIEKLYQEHGLTAIRELITMFRADPQVAQERFDRNRSQ